MLATTLPHEFEEGATAGVEYSDVSQLITALTRHLRKGVSHIFYLEYPDYLYWFPGQRLIFNPEV